MFEKRKGRGGQPDIYMYIRIYSRTTFYDHRRYDEKSTKRDNLKKERDNSPNFPLKIRGKTFVNIQCSSGIEAGIV